MTCWTPLSRMVVAWGVICFVLLSAGLYSGFTTPHNQNVAQGCGVAFGAVALIGIACLVYVTQQESLRLQGVTHQAQNQYERTLINPTP